MIAFRKKLFFFIALFFLVFTAPQVRGAAVVCTANFSPNAIQPNTSNYFTLSISNNDVSTIRWFKITKPFPSLSISGVSASGWNASYTSDSSDITFTGNLLSQENPLTVNFNSNVTAGDGSSGNWSVQASDDPNGTSPTNCGGSAGLSVTSSAPDTTPPSINNLTVSNISATSATVSWTTDENSTSVVNYGLEYPGPGTDSSGTLTTSHSLTLTQSIGALTTYYFQVCSTDSSGNQSCTNQDSFTTPALGATTAPIQPTSTVVTNTVTKIVGPTPTPTPAPDRTPPSTVILSDFSKPYKEAPKIMGKSSDDRSGVAKVEYSIDNGQNWLPVDNGTTNFEFTPLGLEDGNYEIKVRATDGRGNVGISKGYTLVIDRLPPRIGSTLFSLGPQIIGGENDGLIMTLPGLDIQLAMSAVGGPTKINLTVADKNYSLIKNIDNGLWFTNLLFDKPGIYTVNVDSIDGALNTTHKKLNDIIVLDNGRVSSINGPIQDAEVVLYSQDPVSRRFVVWDGSPYGIKNPQRTDKNGHYSLFIPSGTYYLHINKYGFKSINTNIFTTSNSLPITEYFTLEPSRFITFGPWKISLPDFRETTKKISLKIPTLSSYKQESFIGKELPDFNFSRGDNTITNLDLRGKRTVISFLPTWSPSTPQQLDILEGLAKNTEINVVVIVPQEKKSLVEIFRKKGRYNLPIVADSDGDLQEKMDLSSIPTHVFINNKGIIKNIKSGVLTNDELLNNLLD